MTDPPVPPRQAADSSANDSDRGSEILGPSSTTNTSNSSTNTNSRDGGGDTTSGSTGSVISADILNHTITHDSRDSALRYRYQRRRESRQARQSMRLLEKLPEERETKSLNALNQANSNDDSQRPSSWSFPHTTTYDSINSNDVSNSNDDTTNKTDNTPPQQRRRQQNRPRLRRTGIGGGSQVFLPRIVNRDMPYHQSRNRFSVKTSFQRAWRATIALARHDWFHILLRLHFAVALFVLISIWTLMILLFAAFYRIIGSRNLGFNSNCLLGVLDEETGIRDPITFSAAFAFSLQTCTTVGYGLPNGTNSFFEEGCSNLQTVIYFQMVWSMLFNAFMFSFLFSQLSKSETRAIQMVFSNKLCITSTPLSDCMGTENNNVPTINNNDSQSGRTNTHRLDSAHHLDENGPITLTVRCYDLDASFPLVECHVRMYLLDHKMKLHPLRIQDPNDDLGAMLMPSIPTDLVHVIDHHSVLSPTRTMPLVDTAAMNGMPMRSIDSVIGNREEVICPVCGESFGTYERLKRHVEYNALVDEDAGFDPYPASHSGYEMPDVHPIGLEEVKRHIERTLSEIIVVVEAIDPQLSGTFQSLQSYKYDDIQFGADFVRCMYVHNNKFTVDMAKFHSIQRDPEWRNLWSENEIGSNQSPGVGDEGEGTSKDGEDDKDGNGSNLLEVSRGSDVETATPLGIN